MKLAHTQPAGTIMYKRADAEAVRTKQKVPYRGHAGALLVPLRKPVKISISAKAAVSVADCPDPPSPSLPSVQMS